MRTVQLHNLYRACVIVTSAAGGMDGIELLARANSNDSERTKLLKQVLLSSSKLHRELRVTLGTPAPKASKFGTFVPSATLKRQKELQAASPLAASLKEKLELCAQGDSDICETMTPGRELSPVLRSCGARIGNLSDRLSAVEGQLVLRGGALPAREEEETHLIEIVPRGQQASAATRHKAEAAAERALQQHARFAALEDLQNTLQTRFSYDDLRQAFPRRSRWNPNLYLLTDETLKNPAEFKEGDQIRFTLRVPAVYINKLGTFGLFPARLTAIFVFILIKSFRSVPALFFAL
eukprot:s7877_g3.t1